MKKYSKYVGIDAHKKFCFVTTMDQDGEILARQKVNSNRLELETYFDQYGADSIAVLESTYNWIYVHDVMEGRFGEIKLAHPKKVKAIAEASIKNDKVDSEVLAHLLRSNLIPEAYISSKEERSLKDLYRYRFSYVNTRTAFKNRTLSMVSRYINENPYTDMFGRAGTTYMRELVADARVKEIINGYLDTIDNLTSQIKSIDKEIKRHVAETEEMKLLKTIPGIGDMSALLIMAEIGDISRFRTPKKLVSYSGLCPRSSASGGIIHYGSLNKDRNKYLCWIFMECAIPALKASHILLAKYTRIKRNKNYNKAKATIARKLAEAVWKVLTYKRPYQEGVTIQAITKASIKKSVPSATPSLEK